MDGAILARAVEGEDVIAALDTRACPFAMQFFGGTVKARVQDKKRTLPVRVIDTVEVPRKSGISVRDLDRKDRRIVKRTASSIGLNRFFVSPVNAGVFWIAVEEELWAPEGGGGTQVAVARTDAMAGGELSFGFGEDTFCSCVPLAIPAVNVAGGNAI